MLDTRQVLLVNAISNTAYHYKDWCNYTTFRANHNHNTKSDGAKLALVCRFHKIDQNQSYWVFIGLVVILTNRSVYDINYIPPLMLYILAT